MKPEKENMAAEQDQIHPASQMITLRMLMQGKEVGSIIGKKGDNVKKYREESGAKINISDASCFERIVTITGSIETIVKAFTMICKKFEEDIQSTHPNETLSKHLISVRLIIPASQCGSLIGKGGSKIKEIREGTGALIQVASEMLPNSTERTVTISGSADATTQCIYHICDVMVKSPPKGATIPYRPKPVVPPVILAGGQAFTLPQGQFPSIARPEVNTTTCTVPAVSCDPNGVYPSQHNYFEQLSKSPQPLMAQAPGALPMFTGQQFLLPGLLGNGLMIPRAPVISAMPPAANINKNSQFGQTHEMTIPNDLIGCIIGKGGAKINEIRQFSGATIKISNMEAGSTDRKVTIAGTMENINAAEMLINSSIEAHKNMTLEPESVPCSSVLTSNPSLVSLNHLMKPATFPLLGFYNDQQLFDTKELTTKIKTGLTAHTQAASLKKVDKFSPY